MGKRSKRFIPVVRSSEGSWAYRGAAGEKETFRNIESLKKKGINPRDIDIIPVQETRKDSLGRAFEAICLVATIIDLGTNIWKWIKQKESTTTTKD